MFAIIKQKNVLVVFMRRYFSIDAIFRCAIRC